MQNFFEEDKWYRLVDREGFIGCAISINTVIADFIGEKEFEVIVHSDSTNDIEVAKIRIKGTSRWVKTKDILAKSNMCDFFFYYERGGCEELEFFEEVVEPTKEVEELYMLAYKEMPSHKFQLDERSIDGIFFSKEEAEEIASNYLRNNQEGEVRLFKQDAVAVLTKSVTFTRG